MPKFPNTQTPDEQARKVMVVLSGGQDSTYCLFFALHHFAEVHAVTFNYGQRHSRELEAARTIFHLAGLYYPDRIGSHEVCDIGPILQGTSPLVNPDSELEQYADHNALPGGLEKTFVPMRNQLFLTLAANRAFVKGAANMMTGVCEEDFGGYPDCRAVFIDALEKTCNLGTFTEEAGFPGGLNIWTPLMKMTKAKTVLASLDYPGCYEATAYSHTAYDGQYPPVGHDHATLLRAKGFIEANVPDPLVLRAWNEKLMPLPNTINYSADRVSKYMSLMADTPNMSNFSGDVA